MKTNDYQLLQALLKYQAQQLTAEDLTVILKTQGYNLERVDLDRQIVFVAEGLANAIK